MARLGQTVFALVVSTFGGCAAFAQSNDTGVTDREIRVGNTMPYSGPVSAYGIVGRTQQAYFRMINEVNRSDHQEDARNRVATDAPDRRSQYLNRRSHEAGRA
jgi:hypothetical protein